MNSRRRGVLLGIAAMALHGPTNRAAGISKCRQPLGLVCRPLSPRLTSDQSRLDHEFGQLDHKLAQLNVLISEGIEFRMIPALYFVR